MGERRFLELTEQVRQQLAGATHELYLGAHGDPEWRPVPRVDGTLQQDPDFSLPTAAGPLARNLGRVIAREHSPGYRYSTLFDARGLVQAEIDPLGYRTNFLWNAEGSRIALENALSHRTTWCSAAIRV